MNTTVYTIDDKVYINLTNRCSNSCDFCVRNGKETFCDYYLWLDKEPAAADIISELERYMQYDEFVFCGFGEPLYRLDAIIEIAEFLKSRQKNTRINTNGQADLINHGVDTAKLLKGRIDVIGISLNATTAAKYQEICHCDFGEEGYASLLRFAKACKQEGLRVKLSIVDCISPTEIAQAKEIAKSLGVELRIRKYIK